MRQSESERWGSAPARLTALALRVRGELTKVWPTANRRTQRPWACAEPAARSGGAVRVVSVTVGTNFFSL